MTDTDTLDRAPAEVSAGVGGIAADRLRSFIERIESVDERVKELQEDRKEILAEAKGEGWCTKAIGQIVRLRRKDPADRSEEEATLELYLGALGE